MIAAEKFKVANDLVFRGTGTYPSEEERPMLGSNWRMADQMIQRHSAGFRIPIVEEL